MIQGLHDLGDGLVNGLRTVINATVPKKDTEDAQTPLMNQSEGTNCVKSIPIDGPAPQPEATPVQPAEEPVPSQPVNVTSLQQTTSIFPQVPQQTNQGNGQVYATPIEPQYSTPKQNSC